MLAHLVRLRPFSYHCCSEVNFNSIRRARALRSAAELLRASNHEHLLRTRRKKPMLVQLADGPVEIRDNAPLRPGSLALQDGMSLEDFLLELNSRVFLWPGMEDGPILPGRRHFEHYRGIGPVHVLRAPTAALLEANPDRRFSIAYCNSGSARHHLGARVPRGSSTFLTPDEASRPASDVKEFSFPGFARLPPEAEWSNSLSGPWQSL